MALSIKRFFEIAANLVITSSAALVTSGLTSPIAANEKQKIRVWLPFAVGATGGIRWELICPAGASFAITNILYNTVAPSITTSAVAFGQINAIFTNALANAGNHWALVEATVVNGATAGNVDFQVAQNTSDVLSLTVSQGGTMDVEVFS